MAPAADPQTRSHPEHLAASRFRDHFGEPSGIYRAPGRVNLIGEHTDYNDGFVMPAALGFYTYISAGPRSDGKLLVESLDFAELREFEMSSLSSGPTGHWSDYVRGVAAVLQSRRIGLSGANLVIHGNVPIGSGLSSSAALEVSTAFALLGVSGALLDRREIASVCQRAEHDYAGTRCGIMDQFVSCFGRAHHALLLDCRSLQFEAVPVPESVRIVVCNTMVKHELAAGEYNRRRADCESGVRLLQQFLPQIRALRDVTPAQLEEHGAALPEVVLRRCRHVVQENDRVLHAASALQRQDLRAFGDLMAESHLSLRDNYEVSCNELDLMVELAAGSPGVYGARMTGGGFGGCTVNLVDQKYVAEFETAVVHGYQRETGLRPEIYVCAAAEGAGRIDKSPP